MILGIRSVESEAFTGANLVLLRDWTLPIDALGIGCFKTFDETLEKLKSDDESTRIAPIGSSEPLIAELNTASEAARRVLPERFRHSTEFRTLALSRGKTPDSREICSDLPPWVHLSVETEGGDLYRLAFKAGARRDWQRVALNAGDLWLHLSFFSPEFKFRLNRDARPRFKRLAQLVEEASRPEWVETLSIPLHATSEDFA